MQENKWQTCTNIKLFIKVLGCKKGDRLEEYFIATNVANMTLICN